EIGFAIKKGLESHREELLELLRAKAEKLDVYVGGDTLVDGEIENYEISDVEIADFHVVEIMDGEASVNVLCEVSVSADVVADDPDSGIRDSETKGIYYVYRIAGTVVRTVNMTAEVAVKYDVNNPEQITIENANFEENNVELFVEEHELERVDDHDYAH